MLYIVSYIVVLLFVAGAMKRKTPQSRDADARYAELMSFGKSSHVSARGMAALMSQIEKEGLPESFSRSSQYRAKKSICDTDTPYGKLVKYVDVVGTFKSSEKVPKQTPFTIAFQNPMAFLYVACSQSSHYSMIMRAALEANAPSPANPWSIIIYSDGVDPTDTASKTHTRKFIIYYWAFLEFGMEALSHEEVWGTMTIVREAYAKSLDGGIAGLTSLALEQFHGTDFDILRAGLTLNLANGDRVKLFAKVGVMLADEPAFKDMLECKGHSGTKCCFLCQNCVLHKAPVGSVPLHLFSDYTVSIAEPDFKKFHMHSDESLRAIITKLNEYKTTLTTEEFNDRSQMLGFNWNPRSIICNPRFQLQCASIAMFDWGHTYVCDGLADGEFGDFMQIMTRTKSGTTYAELGSYVETFTLPKHRHGLSRLFDPNRYRNYVSTGSFPAIASEFLTLAPILRRFLLYVVVPLGQNAQHVASMLAALDVVDILQACKHRGCVNPMDLYNAITRHFQLFIAAYGANAVRPKHHYALHLPLMLQRFKVLISTLMHERRHKMAKRYSRARQALFQFEKGMVEDVTCHQLWELGQAFFKAGSSSQPRGVIMHALREMFPHAADCDLTLHDDISVNGGSAHNGDVVSFEFEGCQCVGNLYLTIGIARAATEEMDLFSIVSVWDFVDGSDDDFRSYTVTSRQVKIQTSALGTVFTHWLSQCGSRCMVLVPYELRR